MGVTCGAGWSVGAKLWTGAERSYLGRSGLWIRWKYFLVFQEKQASRAKSVQDVKAVETWGTKQIRPPLLLTGTLQEQDTPGGRFDVNQAFVGSLDHVYILNTTLSQDEITSLYSRGRTAGSDEMFRGTNVLLWCATCTTIKRIGVWYQKLVY